MFFKLLCLYSAIIAINCHQRSDRYSNSDKDESDNELYKIDYKIKDKDGVEYARHEVGNDYGIVVGSYVLGDGRGTKRKVAYIADKKGFRANIHTNEVGISDHDTTSAIYNGLDNKHISYFGSDVNIPSKMSLSKFSQKPQFTGIYLGQNNEEKHNSGQYSGHNPNKYLSSSDLYSGNSQQNNEQYSENSDLYSGDFGQNTEHYFGNSDLYSGDSGQNAEHYSGNSGSYSGNSGSYSGNIGQNAEHYSGNSDLYSGNHGQNNKQYSGNSKQNTDKYSKNFGKYSENNAGKYSELNAGQYSEKPLNSEKYSGHDSGAYIKQISEKYFGQNPEPALYSAQNSGKYSESNTSQPKHSEKYSEQNSDEYSGSNSLQTTYLVKPSKLKSGYSGQTQNADKSQHSDKSAIPNYI